MLFFRVKARKNPGLKTLKVKKIIYLTETFFLPNSDDAITSFRCTVAKDRLEEILKLAKNGPPGLKHDLSYIHDCIISYTHFFAESRKIFFGN